MTNVIDTAKAAVIAHNEKNWDKARATLLEKGVYDEKATDGVLKKRTSPSQCLPVRW